MKKMSSVLWIVGLVIVCVVAWTWPFWVSYLTGSSQKTASVIPQREEVVVGLQAKVSFGHVVDAYSSISGGFSDRCVTVTDGILLVKAVGETHVVAMYTPPRGERETFDSCPEGLVLVDKFTVSLMNAEYRRYQERLSQEQKAREFGREFLDNAGRR